MTTTTAPTAKEAILAALARKPDATATELAQDAGLGRSTAAKALAALEAEGQVRRTLGGRDGARRLADRWAPATVTDQPTTRPKKRRNRGSTQTAPTISAAEAGARLGKGQLRGKVLEHLRAQPGGEFTPNAVAKALGHSSGAVGNALVRLAAAGEVEEVSDRPRRYAVPPHRR